MQTKVLATPEIENNSDLKLFVYEEEDENETIGHESLDDKANVIQWSLVLTDIDIQPFSIPCNPTKDLRENATAKGFFNLCAMCAKAERKCYDSHTFETTFVCKQCCSLYRHAKCVVIELVFLNGKVRV